MSDLAEGQYHVELLSERHERLAFSCGNESLDRYLHQQAGQDRRRYAAVPFVLVEDSNPEVLGYYTLSAFGVDLGELPQTVARKLPRYPVVPATLLGRLAVALSRRGRGLGELLLMDALRRSLGHAQEIASVAVVVDAIDEAAWAFYHRFNFLPFPNRRDRLFLPMRTVAQLFE